MYKMRPLVEVVVAIVVMRARVVGGESRKLKWGGPGDGGWLASRSGERVSEQATEGCKARRLLRHNHTGTYSHISTVAEKVTREITCKLL